MIFDADKLFLFMNQLALFGWILLIVFPSWKGTRIIVVSGGLSILMAVVYICLIIVSLPQAQGGFGSLEQVYQLFSHPYALLAGWVHYLAFDLFIGGWIVKDAKAHAIKHVFLIPVLLLTFMFGPAGLLLYFLLRKGFQFRHEKQS
ncbi:MAG: ABA4-like family protein [Thioalkalispiraceae bacterium]